MRHLSDPLLNCCLLSGRPNVGALMTLCEENFILLLRLAPGIRQEKTGLLVAHRPACVDLHLEIQEQSRYTTLIRLTHYFSAREATEPKPEPDARLRIYHDARQVEVLDLRQSVLPLRSTYAHPALSDKWRANLFMTKWLEYCLRQGYRFGHRAIWDASSDCGVAVHSCI